VLAPSDYTGINWANPIAKTASAPLTAEIISSSGISPEFFAGLYVMQLHQTYRTININSWVYQSTTP
jgi:hypothetical protein